MTITTDAADIFRDMEAPGSEVPHEPEKPRIRTLFADIDTSIQAVAEAGSGAYIIKQTEADLNADLAHDAGVYAQVIADDQSPPANGYYIKVGASGAGSWDYVGPDPASVAAAAAAQSASDAAASVTAAGEQADIAEEWASEAAVSAASFDAKVEFVSDAEGMLITFEDDSDNVLGGVDPAGRLVAVTPSGELIFVQEALAELEGAASFARIERAFPAYAGAPTTFPDWLAVEGYGQSNWTGANGQPAITLAATFPGRALTFNGGPKANPDNAVTTMVSTKDLVEDDLSGDGSAGRGETPASGAANGLLERLYISSGDPLTDFPVMFAHTAAIGGQSISSLLTTYYARFTTSVQEVFDVAGPASLAFGATLYDGNEANQGGTAQAAWQAALRTMYNQTTATIVGITSQTFDPIMLVPQKSWSAQPTANTASGTPNTYPASVTLGSVAEQGDGLFVAFPDYATFLKPESDGIHRGPIGHKLAGHYYARALKRILFDGLDWRGLSARAAWIVAADSGGDSDPFGYCYVKFDVPVQPIVLDYDFIGAATQAGFKIQDDSGDLPITSVAVTAGDVLRLTLGRARDGAVTLRGGLDYLPELSGLADESAGTNLRDSDTENVVIEGATYTLANWLLAFEMTPLITEGA